MCGKPTVTGGACRNPARSCAARHPTTAGTVGGQTAGALAATVDPLAPPDALTALAADPNGYYTVGVGEREGVALDPSTPPETLAALAGDSHWAVRMSVAGNLNASAETLTALAGDSDDGVRSVVEAALQGTAPDRVAELAQDDHWMVRYRVASRGDLPVDVLVELANDWDRKVREGARSNPAFTGPVAAHAGLLAD